MVKNRAKARQAKKGKAFKPPLVQAYIRVARASKQIQRLEASMSHAIHREIMTGVGAKEHMFSCSRPCMFANKINLVLNNEKNKIEKKSNTDEILLGDLNYDIRIGIVKNETDGENKLNFPDLKGRKMHPEGPIDGYTKTYVAGDDIADPGKTSIKHILKADIDNKQTHRFMSLLCREKEIFKTWLQKYSIQIGIPEDDFDENELVNAFKSIIEERGYLKHKSESHDKIKTADYIIHVLSTTHEYTSRNEAYGLKIYKKNIFSSVIHSKDTLNIPVCEELIIQLKQKDTSGIKNIPSLVNASHCLVMSMGIKSSEPKTSPYASLHFFGDDAFSLVFSNQTQHIIQDRTKLCARLAGKLCRLLLDVHSNDNDKRDSITKYLGRMFDETAYSANKDDLRTLKNMILGSINRQNNPELEEYFKLQQVPTQYEKKFIELGNIPAHDFQEKQKLYAELLEIEKILHPDIKDTSLNLELLETQVANRLNAIDPKYSKLVIFQSFIMRQKIRSLIRAEMGAFCSVRKCISSQSFSVLALNPEPGKNYVFVVSFFNNVANSQQQDIGPVPYDGNCRFFSNMSHAIENDKDQFDLEHELSLVSLEPEF